MQHVAKEIRKRIRYNSVQSYPDKYPTKESNLFQILCHSLSTYCCQELHCQKTDGRLKKKTHLLIQQTHASVSAPSVMQIQRCPAEDGLLLIHLQNMPQTNCLTYGRFGRLFHRRYLKNSLAFSPSHPVFSFFSIFTNRDPPYKYINSRPAPVLSMFMSCLSLVEKWVK